MKKVLIIGYFWPYVFYGGRRIIALANYLHEFGWYPIILTVPLSEKIHNDRFKVIEVPFKGDIFQFWRRIFIKIFKADSKRSLLRQAKEKLGGSHKKSYIDFLFNIYQEVFGYPDTEKGWKIPVLQNAKKIIEKEKIDAVISEWPIISHIVARELKKLYKIPWVADFVDLWSQNHDYPFSRIRKHFDKKLEIKTLKSADVLITVSQYDAEKMKRLHRGKLINVITNGFDPEEVNIPPANLIPKFTITYTGKIYPGKQDPSKILVALKDLISNKLLDPNEIEVRFYGHKEYWLEKEIEKYGLSNIIKQYGMLPREAAIEKQRESQILLLLNWEDPREKGCYTGKIFEYLAAQRPILATGGFGSDVVEELLEETKAGVYCQKVEDIKNALEEFCLEYKQRSKVTYNGDRVEINKYSYREMAKKFVDLLNKLHVTSNLSNYSLSK